MMAGETVDNIEGLDIVTYRGTRMTVGATSVAQVLQMAIKEGWVRQDLCRKQSTQR